MTRTQIIPVFAVSVLAIGVAGYLWGRQARPAPAIQAAIAAKPAPLATVEKDVVHIEPSAPAVAEPKPAAAAKAKKSRIPGGLAGKLKATDAQKAAIEEVLHAWDATQAELVKKRKGALEAAKSVADKAARRQVETQAWDEWRRDITVAKAEHHQKLQAVMTPEQYIASQEYRQGQYQKWLDQHANIQGSMIKGPLKLTPEQSAQVQSLVRSSVNDLTLGGMSVPPSTQRDSAQQALRQQIRGLLTPAQAETFDALKQAFSFSY